ALVVLHLAAGLEERALPGARDDLDELGVVAAGLAADEDVVGDDVGGVAGALAVLAAEHPDVGGARAGRLLDLAEPAAPTGIRDGQRPHQRRRDALLRVNPSVGGAAEDLRLPALGAHGPDGDLLGRAAIDVEAHHRVAEHRLIDVAGAPQPALLAHGEE